MLFNSYLFIFIFLPIVYLGSKIFETKSRFEYRNIWLILCSLFFYGWWDFSYVPLILFSVAFNFICGKLINKYSSNFFLFFGILGNLILLSYYKYANFFIENLNIFSNSAIDFELVILPLAISFFTFQQIAFLVDAYRKEVTDYSFTHYCLFVTFFPQLLAGPIVHHKEIIVQFSNQTKSHLTKNNLVIGLAIFSIGLFKKAVIADSAEPYASPIFDAANNGEILTFIEAWLGAIAFSFQIYFDFSGYCDMAIGVARIFGIMLPINFSSPYKSTNIIDFWRNWHITLSRFLKDYLYISLGGNRKGKFRKYINLFVTMLLGGLWHGAGWTFIFWGLLHGFYLVVNNIWRQVFILLKIPKNSFGFIGNLTAQIITVASIVIAWVFFRADSFDSAFIILSAMLGENGIVLPDFYFIA
jgi:D-alanyl-lipoteichoic acid acyltransferase DltB (MBOAT superfamily)